MGFFVCFPVVVIKTHIAWDIFHTGKFSLLLLVSFLKAYFIVKASFFKCLLRKQKTILTFQPPTRFLCENLSQPASPACTRAPKQQLSGGKAEGRHGKQGTKKKEKWEKNSRFKKLKSWLHAWPIETINSWKQVQEGPVPLLGVLLGTGWEREAQKQKVSLLSPQCHLPSNPTDSSLDKQLFGMYKQNEVAKQSVKENKTIKGNMLCLLEGIFKRTHYAYNPADLGQRNYTHMQTPYRERIPHELYKSSQLLQSNFFFSNDWTHTYLSPTLFPSLSLCISCKTLKSG